MEVAMSGVSQYKLCDVRNLIIGAPDFLSGMFGFAAGLHQGQLGKKVLQCETRSPRG
jgi:hypothetical protein